MKCLGEGNKRCIVSDSIVSFMVLKNLEFLSVCIVLELYWRHNSKTRGHGSYAANCGYWGRKKGVKGSFNVLQGTEMLRQTERCKLITPALTKINVKMRELSDDQISKVLQKK